MPGTSDGLHQHQPRAEAAVQQVITGALNRQEHGGSAYSLGSVEGIHFVVCAVGTDVVILTPALERVQVIPGRTVADRESHVVGAVHACTDSGKISATYGRTIKIFEPTHYAPPSAPTKHGLDYRWFETAQITVSEAPTSISAVLWSLEGMRLLVVSGNRMELFQHRALGHFAEQRSSSQPPPAKTVMFKIEEDANIISSIDGSFFATCGANDTLVSVWYQDNELDAYGYSSAGVLELPSFAHTLLAHPARVVGLEWRKTGRYMPRKCIQNVLLTWCEDNTTRVWKETPPADTTLADLVGENFDGMQAQEMSPKKRHSFLQRHFRVKSARQKLVGRLKGLMPERRRRIEQGSAVNGTAVCGTAAGLLAHLSKSASYPEFPTGWLTGHNVNFHLAATINAESGEVAAGGRPLVVHWLNNKELQFSIGVEKLLCDAIIHQHDYVLQKSDSSLDEGETTTHDSSLQQHPHSSQPLQQQNHQSHDLSGSTDTLSSKDVLDVRLEALLKQWTRSSDVLFAMHPLDGSLLTWTVEFLDDSIRGPVVSFASRCPSALPLSDARTLHPHVATLLPHHPLYIDVMHSSSVAPEDVDAADEWMAEWRLTRSIALLTCHDNGSLNLWRLAMDATSGFVSVLSMAHAARVCGHRFEVAQVVPHSVLPLVLTASHYQPSEEEQENGSVKPGNRKEWGGNVASELIIWHVSAVGPLCESGGLRELARTQLSGRCTVPERLAWIPTVVPNSALGPVAGRSPSACFMALVGGSLVVYQAVVDARSLLAELERERRKAARAAALVDAAEQRLEDGSPAISKTNEQALRVAMGMSRQQSLRMVSEQSTARPGCVLEVARLEGVLNDEDRQDGIIFAHVYEQSFIEGGATKERASTEGEDDDAVAKSFDAVFYAVFITAPNSTNGKQTIVTCKLRLVATDDEVSEETKGTLLCAIVQDGVGLQQAVASALKVVAQRVGRQEIQSSGGPLVSAEPAASHLASAALYPAGRALYLLLGHCSDQSVHFYRCAFQPETGQVDWTEWRMLGNSDSALDIPGVVYAYSAAHFGRFACIWDASRASDETAQEALLTDQNEVTVAVFECESSGGVEWLREDTMRVRTSGWSVRASTGDVDCTEMRSPIDDFVADVARKQSVRQGPPLLNRIPSKSSITSGAASPGQAAVAHCSEMKRAVTQTVLKAEQFYASMKLRAAVRIDWAATEQGAHVLTVAVANTVHFYCQVTPDTAQRTVALLAPEERAGPAGAAALTHRRGSLRRDSSIAETSTPGGSRLARWLCVRVLELGSADGLPPIPTSLTWTRDGLLVVGMRSEMRCYSQWQLKTKAPMLDDVAAAGVDGTPKISNGGQSSAKSTPRMTGSASHSMLEQLGGSGSAQSSGLSGGRGGAGNEPAARNRLFLDMVHRILSRQDLASVANAPGSGATTMHHNQTFGASTRQDLESVLDAVAAEGLFEAVRLASPVLPQYHPKLLIALLNAGRTKRVKAILRHVLSVLKDRRQLSLPNALSRAASIRRRHSITSSGSLGLQPTNGGQLDSTDEGIGSPDLDTSSGSGGVGDIAPLPLSALLAADEMSETDAQQKAQHVTEKEAYDELFGGGANGNGYGDDDDDDDDLDALLAADADKKSIRSRTFSTTSADPINGTSSLPWPVSIRFTPRHCRALTELLTHTHLSGLSSVDQMHLLAIADTLSHFSSEVSDRLAQANATVAGGEPKGIVGMPSPGRGYAPETMGLEKVDECGLRYVMALKQREYLLRCLPLKQRQLLKSHGLASSNVIWALHSDTQSELLNIIPCWQKGSPTWEELRSLGLAWWLTDTATLRTAFERIATTAFKANQDPMDAALYYLALKKKSVLTHLFKTVRDVAKADFFAHDFETDAFWKMAASKNAFVLMSKQRHLHAAAFFLLAGSLKDAVQVVTTQLRDVQLALSLVRLWEPPASERQHAEIKALLCREVFSLKPEEFDGLTSWARTGKQGALPLAASPDPFERSMAAWMLRDYRGAALTLVEEAAARKGGEAATTALSDIFAFYTFLRKHPLVIRHNLVEEGGAVSLSLPAVAKISSGASPTTARTTPAERRLFFRTAAEHMAHGCPLLALEVLLRLPAGSDGGSDQNGERGTATAVPEASEEFLAAGNGASLLMLERPKNSAPERATDFDWSQPVTKQEDEELKLDWGDDGEEEEGDGEKDAEQDKPSESKVPQVIAPTEKSTGLGGSSSSSSTSLDVLAQHLKFVACLRILTHELATLASGCEVDGGQLRYQLFSWLENEICVLERLCDYTGWQHAEAEAAAALARRSRTTSAASPHDGLGAVEEDEQEDGAGNAPLHEVLVADRERAATRARLAARRHAWLRAHERLLRTLTSHCELHAALNHRLTSALMELLLLLLELHDGPDGGAAQQTDVITINRDQTFPLLSAALSTPHSSALLVSPLHFVETQCRDLLDAFHQLSSVGRLDASLSRVYTMYNLAQGLAACLYQVLSDADRLPVDQAGRKRVAGVLTARRRSRHASAVLEDGPGGSGQQVVVTSLPNAWPGLDGIVDRRGGRGAQSGGFQDEVDGEGAETQPAKLRLLLVECWVAVAAALFSFALAAHDARWLFRLAAHQVDARRFADVFGGAGTRKLRAAPPQRPPPPGSSAAATTTAAPSRPPPPVVDPIRNRLNSKILATGSTRASGPLEQKVTHWVPPVKSLLQFFAEKPNVEASSLGVDYDSEGEDGEQGQKSKNEDFAAALEYDDEEDVGECEALRPGSYAWTLLRAAAARQMSLRLRQFVALAGWDVKDLAAVSWRVDTALQQLDSWAEQLADRLRRMSRPANLVSVPDPAHDPELSQLGFDRYRVLEKAGATPFESFSAEAAPIRRLWAFLVRQDRLKPLFVHFVFGHQQSKPLLCCTNEASQIGAMGTGTSTNALPLAFRILQKEQDPVLGFAMNPNGPAGQLVVSTGRELQELDVTVLLDEATSGHGGWMTSRASLDAAIYGESRLSAYSCSQDASWRFSTGADENLRPGGEKQQRSASPNMLLKRTVGGIRRLDWHPNAQLYLSGASDGSVRLWEWAVGQPLYTARVAGSHSAKVNSIAFSPHGARFAAVDTDGQLSVWLTADGTAVETRAPYLSFKVRSKTANDVRFCGLSNTLLLVAGQHTGDINVALVDTLMPTTRAVVHSFQGHADGATQAIYLPAQQTIYSTGRHGEMHVWDVRARQLRQVVKVFEHSSAVRSLAVDPNHDMLVLGSADGDVKIFSADSVSPQPMYVLAGEHAHKSGGFSLRAAAAQAGAGLGGVQALQGVQQLYVDQRLRLFSCGADSALRVRQLPTTIGGTPAPGL